ncbi:uncharacterized protein METZ01_LOCUS378259 [marine metagenome]|uniref:Uncharacterized protein n=1 Tax=marine metagenome TaxID=408172 RepID=A0A382TUN5_9ZZZZ
MKRNLDYYPYYFEYAAKIDSATQVLGSYFLQDPLNFNGELTRIAIERSSSGEYLSNVE